MLISDMDLDTLPSFVSKLHIVVNVYSSGHGFSEVSDAYIRLAAIKNGHEFARYKLDAAVKTNGMVFATLFRSPVGTWMLKAMVSEAVGWVADEDTMLAALKIKGRSEHRRHIPPPASGDECCTVS